MAAPEDFFDNMKRLAVEDPKAAKVVFLEAFERNGFELVKFLERLRKANEWRLRQLVANAIRTHPEKQRIVSDLAMWRQTETDEFTRRALEFALRGVDTAAVAGRPQWQSPLPAGMIETYRYVSSRMRHRLRNAMLPAQAYASILATLPTADQHVQEAAAKFNDAMKSLSRELEATEVDPEYFNMRSIALADWLKQLNRRYSERYRSIGLRLIAADDAPFRVSANDHLLETIFWNIWLNAQQAIGPDCQITLELGTVASDVVVLVLDNGDGFSRDLLGVAFQQEYSTKDEGSGGRGRGLLEIQDAVERLGGRAELTEERAAGLRIQIRLPLET